MHASEIACSWRPFDRFLDGCRLASWKERRAREQSGDRKLLAYKKGAWSQGRRLEEARKEMAEEEERKRNGKYVYM